jgi:hypothetical protein
MPSAESMLTCKQVVLNHFAARKPEGAMDISNARRDPHRNGKAICVISTLLLASARLKS